MVMMSNLSCCPSNYEAESYYVHHESDSELASPGELVQIGKFRHVHLYMFGMLIKNGCQNQSIPLIIGGHLICLDPCGKG